MDVFQYDDFKLFLRDAYEEKKSVDSKYSYRRFAKDADLSNPGYLNDIIKARRPLSYNAAEKIANVFCTTPKEKEFFHLLVDWNQEKNEKRREVLYRRVRFSRDRSHFARTNPAMVRYYDDIRYPLVRAAIEVLDFRGEYEHLCWFLETSMSIPEAKKIVRDLCDWEMVTQRTDGRYVVTGRFVEPCPTLREQVRHINRQWIIKALEIQKKYSPQRRHISTMLLAVSQSMEKRILLKVEQFREEIFKMLEDDAQPEKLMQLNVQFFPHTKSTNNL